MFKRMQPTQDALATFYYAGASVVIIEWNLLILEWAVDKFKVLLKQVYYKHMDMVKVRDSFGSRKGKAKHETRSKKFCTSIQGWTEIM